MNNENGPENVAVDMARFMNYGSHAEQLAIPLLNNFNVIKSENPQVVFVSSAEAFVYQVVSDGPLRSEETFDDRVNLVVRNTKEYMKQQNMDDVDKSFFFYKDYKNDTFGFKVYVQDLILTMDNQKKVVRQLNAYFVEPRFNDFYQVTVSAGPFSMPTQMLKLGTVDLENDQITKILDTMMDNVLNNLKYR